MDASGRGEEEDRARASDAQRSGVWNRALLERVAACRFACRVFLIGDAVGCAMAGQKVPDGYYHLDRMILSATRRGAQVGCCGTCMDARGINDEMLTEGALRSSMDELTEWTLWADKVVTF